MSTAKREEQEHLCKEILKLLNRLGTLHWVDIQKKMIVACRPYATPARITAQMKYLMKKGFIVRVSRGIYQISDAGKKYLELM